MKIACDEAGHTGPDLLATDQRFFAFASVSIDDVEAWEIIQAVRTRHPVQMPELKAARLMNSRRGRDLIADVVSAIRGRFAVIAHNKLVATLRLGVRVRVRTSLQVQSFYLLRKEPPQIRGYVCLSLVSRIGLTCAKGTSTVSEIHAIKEY